MLVRSRWTVAAFVVGCCCAPALEAQVTPTPPAAPQSSAPQVTEEVRDGIKYQVTRQVVQQTVPTTVMQDRQQTVMTQQVTTETIAHQQVYSVPVTQYEMVGTLHGRWNPFVEPYWTYEMQPVTYYQEQVANVQIPMNKVTWVPQTKTVQVPVTEFRTAEQEIVTRVALTGGESAKTYAATQPTLPQPATMQPYNSQLYSPPVSSIASQPASGYPVQATPLPTYANQQPAYGYAQPGYNSVPSAVATRPNMGGQMLQTDPPRQGSGWSTIPSNSGYR
ncbi:MAG: hypothetical protein SH868_17390 [Bythopirellula sp.]|nr:hypothetical protein [Bythopirellula sp.]